MAVEPTFYRLNYSQDIIHLQTQYALFKRVANILFSVTVEKGFDEALMRKAVALVFQRNDCLRIRFVKRNKQILQYFEPTREPGPIGSKVFATTSSLEAFIRKFRRKALNLYKGEALQVVFARDPSGKQMLICKISHYVADTYGIGVLVEDLLAVYDALAAGQELPDAPGSFEAVVRKDNEYRDNEDLTRKDREFFKEYYTLRHPQAPTYCSIHGDRSDRWLKQKRAGKFSMPYFLVRCDTTGYRFVIPAALTGKVEAWCEENEIPMGTFFYYACALTVSLLSGKTERMAALELLNCRGTVADRKAAGTKVQSLAIYNTVDYSKSFLENVRALFEEQSELYRHTRLTYLELEDLQHKQWGYSMLSSVNGFCFSFIPMATREGVTLEVYSNGKGALVCYMALVLNVNTHEISVTYDVQDLMVTPEILIDFQNEYIHVAEKVLDSSAQTLNELF